MSYIAAGNTVTTAVTVNGDTTGNLIFTTSGANTTALTISNAQAATFAGTLATASQGITHASLPAGTVLQVVQGTSTTENSTTGNSFVASSLSAAITPKFSTSKILVRVASVCTNTGSGQGNYTIYRGATNLGGGGQSTFSQYYSSANYSFVPIIMEYLDSPATTSSTTYQVYFKTNSGGTTTIFGSANPLQTITLMEIAA